MPPRSESVRAQWLGLWPWGLTSAPVDPPPVRGQVLCGSGRSGSNDGPTPDSPNWFCEHSHSCDITWCSSVRTTGIAYLHTRCCFSAEHTTLGCSIIVTNLSLWTLCSFTLAKGYISPQTQSFPKPYQSTWFSVIKSNQLVKAKVKSNWKQHRHGHFVGLPNITSIPHRPELPWHPWHLTKWCYIIPPNWEHIGTEKRDLQQADNNAVNFKNEYA